MEYQSDIYSWIADISSLICDISKYFEKLQKLDLMISTIRISDIKSWIRDTKNSFFDIPNSVSGIFKFTDITKSRIDVTLVFHRCLQTPYFNQISVKSFII